MAAGPGGDSVRAGPPVIRARDPHGAPERIDPREVGEPRDSARPLPAGQPDDAPSIGAKAQRGPRRGRACAGGRAGVNEGAPRPAAPPSKWWGWGDPERRLRIPPEGLATLRAQIGDGHPTERVPLEAVAVPEPAPLPQR